MSRCMSDVVLKRIRIKKQSRLVRMFRFTESLLSRGDVGIMVQLSASFFLPPPIISPLNKLDPFAYDASL